MKAPAWHILVVDDEPNIRKLLKGVLEDEGYSVSVAADAREAEAELGRGAVDLVLLDIQLPGEDGLSLLRRWQAEEAQIPVIMMSGHGTIRTAVEATRAGALDFVEKPIQAERLLMSLANALQLGRLKTENVGLRRDLAEAGEIIGGSPAVLQLRDTIQRAAATDARVLITGENGTGKELVAQALFAGSSRRDRPFVKINCAAIPSELLESELFGHERGAFTGAVSLRRGKFELAQKGTLLLDEIGDMNPTTQAKLLRILEEQEMTRIGGEQIIKLDVRIFSSTNRDLDRLLETGRFREDLFHRLNVLPIRVPPLRERSGDVLLLAEHFLDAFGRAAGREPLLLSPDAAELLRRYAWPGNVRELKNLCERLTIMIRGRTIERADVEPLVGASDRESSLRNAKAPVPISGAPLADLTLAFERKVVSEALSRHEGNIAAAARELSLDRANLHRRMKRLQLKP